MTKFFDFYGKLNIIFKILLVWLLVIFCLLWVIGSLAHWDRCIMFMIGAIAAFVLTMCFYPQIISFIATILGTFGIVI